MINFHKYGFLDVKRLTNLVEEKNFWLYIFNPVWLFIHNELYNPQICFENNAIFIKIDFMDLKSVYIEPIGIKPLDGIEIIKNELRNQNLDANLICYSYPIGNLVLYENQFFQTKVYALEEIIANKKSRRNAKKFIKAHKSSYLKKMKKDDFKDVIEFFQEYNLKYQLDHFNYFKILNSLNLILQHLYELDFKAMLVIDDSKIIGLAVGNVISNTMYLDLLLCLDEKAVDYLIIEFCKNALLYSRYIASETSLLDKYKEYKIEKCYTTFRL